jgi:hypothetical protein
LARAKWYKNKIICHYCLEDMGKRKTRDHVIPRSKGGKGNTVWACDICNSIRGNMPYHLFLLMGRLGCILKKMDNHCRRRNWYKEAKKMDEHTLVNKILTFTQ